VRRVLKPGGRLYAEDVLASLINHPVMKWLLDHPRVDRFDTAAFQAGLTEAGFRLEQARSLEGAIAWFAAERTGSGPRS